MKVRTDTSICIEAFLSREECIRFFIKALVFILMLTMSIMFCNIQYVL